MKNRIAGGGSDAQTYVLLGDAYDREELLGKAWSAYSEAIAHSPGAEENYLALAAFSIEHRNAALALDVLGYEGLILLTRLGEIDSGNGI